jgi:myosin heavy subunit
VSVNPFKALPLYTPQTMDLYKEGPRGKPPHVFAVGHNAYYEVRLELYAVQEYKHAHM